VKNIEIDVKEIVWKVWTELTDSGQENSVMNIPTVWTTSKKNGSRIKSRKEITSYVILNTVCMKLPPSGYSEK
jgi:hypothetical protein